MVDANLGRMSEAHKLLVYKLASRGKLGDPAREAIAATTLTLREIAPGTQLVRDGDAPAPICSLVVEGMALRHKVTSAGMRQIVAIELPGDFLDVQHLFLNVADHNVEALTAMRVADIDRHALGTLALDHPDIGRALWVDALISASLAREWLTNVGRRDSRSSVAHLLCELAVRSRAIHPSPLDALALPLTQEQIGDITGLTAVHVNRTLKGLQAEGFITQSGRHIRYLDFPALQAAADFNPRYLHLDQGEGLC